MTDAAPQIVRRHADRLMLWFGFSLLAFGVSLALGWWAVTGGHHIAMHAAVATTFTSALYSLVCWLFLARTRMHVRRMAAEERARDAGQAHGGCGGRGDHGPAATAAVRSQTRATH